MTRDRSLRAVAVRHPVSTLCVVAIGVSVPLLVALLVAGLDVMPGKLVELVLLTALAVVITAWIGGRAAVRRLLAGLTRWRIGVSGWLVVLAAMPALTLAVALVTGTLTPPPSGWAEVAGSWLLIFVFVLLTASVWEETAWAGFVQTRLMARHGLLRGSLLTAVPFCVIHLPLAFEGAGWAGTSWRDAAINWAWLLAALPFFRYLAGILLVDTGGSVLAVAVLHASFNASGSLSVLLPYGWQYVPAMILLTVIVAGLRALRQRGARPPASDERRPALLS